MKEVIHAVQGVFHAGHIPHVADIVLDLIGLIAVAHIVLFLLIPTENADFLDIRIQEPVQHRAAEGAGAAGNHQSFAAEKHIIRPPRRS